MTIIRGRPAILFTWLILASSLLFLLRASPTRAAGEGCVTAVCHATMGKAKYVHGPIGGGNCRVCHQPRSPAIKGPAHQKSEMSVPVASPALCTKCHANVKEQLARSHPHKPVANVNCGFCHDAHQSQDMFMLRRLRGDGKPRIICYSCHRDKEWQIKQGPLVHKPAADGRCTSCHAPHGAYNAGLLHKPQLSLCSGCHKLKWHQRKVVHGPVAGGLCSACHDPHAASQKKLLRRPANKICPSCHSIDTLQKGHATVKESHKDFAQKCLECHDPHATNNPHLVKGS